jgi:nucleotide-binding universal stress UspA family protein
MERPTRPSESCESLRATPSGQAGAEPRSRLRLPALDEPHGHDLVEGTFVTRGKANHPVTTGHWRVERRRARSEGAMKILFATDGSECSRAALDAIVERPWPAGTEARAVSVALLMPYVTDPFLLGNAVQYRSFDAERARADGDASSAAEQIHTRAPELATSSVTLEGSPAAAILDEAQRWGADLIVVGSHGRGAAARFLLGSVSQSVALHAPCSVEIVRAQHEPQPG